MIAVLAPSSAPEKWRFNVQQYDLLYEDGFFPNQSVELVEGEIYEKHPNTSVANPLGEPHPCVGPLRNISAWLTWGFLKIEGCN
jgi:hypothetical protein